MQGGQRPAGQYRFIELVELMPQGENGKGIFFRSGRQVRVMSVNI